MNGSIAEAVKGKFGDVPFTERATGSKPFIKLLMALYWAFELNAVASRVRYLSLIKESESIVDVHAKIRAFRSEVRPRARRLIPH